MKQPSLRLLDAMPHQFHTIRHRCQPTYHEPKPPHRFVRARPNHPHVTRAHSPPAAPTMILSCQCVALPECLDSCQCSPWLEPARHLPFHESMLSRQCLWWPAPPQVSLCRSYPCMTRFQSSIAAPGTMSLCLSACLQGRPTYFRPGRWQGRAHPPRSHGHKLLRRHLVLHRALRLVPMRLQGRQHPGSRRVQMATRALESGPRISSYVQQRTREPFLDPRRWQDFSLACTPLTATSSKIAGSESCSAFRCMSHWFNRLLPVAYFLGDEFEVPAILIVIAR